MLTPKHTTCGGRVARTFNEDRDIYRSFNASTISAALGANDGVIRAPKRRGAGRESNEQKESAATAWVEEREGRK